MQRTYVVTVRTPSDGIPLFALSDYGQARRLAETIESPAEAKLLANAYRDQLCLPKLTETPLAVVLTTYGADGKPMDTRVKNLER